jgi:hypothetical protein
MTARTAHGALGPPDPAGFLLARAAGTLRTRSQDPATSRAEREGSRHGAHEPPRDPGASECPFFRASGGGPAGEVRAVTRLFPLPWVTR